MMEHSASSEPSVSLDDLGPGLVPPPPSDGMPESFGASVPQNLQATRSASQLEAQHSLAIEKARRENRALVPMPNGELGFLDEENEFIGTHGYLSGKHEAMVGDALRIIADPTPGAIYVWAAKYTPRGDRPNPMTIANIRAHRYIPVPVERLRPDVDLPIESHKIGGFAAAGLIDVVLMEVPAAAQKQLYRWRTFESKRRTVRWQAFEDLNTRVRQTTGGGAFAQVERKE
ncbi:MAG: hypothetical protein KGL39_08970 [Patescibacteria group bacterium]|nr:hypothetical protein [Patescibacteria group bacterium]